MVSAVWSFGGTSYFLKNSFVATQVLSATDTLGFKWWRILVNLYVLEYIEYFFPTGCAIPFRSQWKRLGIDIILTECRGIHATEQNIYYFSWGIFKNYLLNNVSLMIYKNLQRFTVSVYSMRILLLQSENEIPRPNLLRIKLKVASLEIFPSLIGAIFKIFNHSWNLLSKYHVPDIVESRLTVEKTSKTYFLHAAYGIQTFRDWLQFQREMQIFLIAITQDFFQIFEIYWNRIISLYVSDKIMLLIYS